MIRFSLLGLVVLICVSMCFGGMYYDPAIWGDEAKELNEYEAKRVEDEKRQKEQMAKMDSISTENAKKQKSWNFDTLMSKLSQHQKVNIVVFEESGNIGGILFGGIQIDKNTRYSTDLNELLENGGEVLTVVQEKEGTSSVVYKTRYTNVSISNLWYIKLTRNMVKKQEAKAK